MNNLAKYDNAKRALAEVYRVDEVKNIRDQAVALRLYAMQAQDRALVDHATEIRLRAERRAGELLKDMAQSGERAVRKNMKSQPATSKLSDLGINKSQSSRWQRLADIPEDDFEETVARAKQKASAAVDNAQQPKPKSKPKPKAKPEPHLNGNGGDANIIAACLREIVPIMRAAIIKLDAGKRLVFCDELRTAVRTLVAEVTKREAETDHWTETAH